ncbi:LTA synthase family protein [Psychroserpens ponticola]|uniref:LTA synthase family protein n=1 Tax=Psychroserpens ponticola TaxID=2932268 RepID=A0ABY7S0A0_9FLAO|nr:LTA synthase family protein [Psychroserpens ponticola]WCO02757.1 LTA synthase family protein [Psychroserpens ponticola]
MKKILFLKPVFMFFLLGIIITTCSRFILFIWFSERVTEIENYWLIFPIGLRIDVILLSYIAVLPTVLILLLPDNWLPKINTFIRFYFIAFLFLLLFMELATPNFILQYDTRPNRLFVEYLEYPKEVFGMLLKSFLGIMIFAVVALSIIGYVLVKYSKNWFKVASTSSYWFKLICLPFVASLLFLGARSSLTSKRPINASDAVFCTDQLTNNLALNSLYTVGFAIYSLKNEENAIDMYGKLPIDKALKRVKKYMTPTESDYHDSEIPLLHLQESTHKREKPYNLVIFLQESLGAEYVGSLGGLPLTPNFDALSKEGLLFTNLYATGTRSVRGIEAVTTGFLPTPSRSVVKLGKSQNGFFTLADALKRKGYQTSFVYGGSANFDNMASFFNGNGFDNIIDERDYKKEEYDFKGNWGVSDESLVKKGNQLYASYIEKPFFSLMFSSSNHEPFEFPDGKIELYDEKKSTVNNAIKYADYAIGEFFKLAKKEAYYNNTVFIVIADHNTRTWGKDLIPVNKFHIPALIIAPNIEGGITYDKLCSQLDIPPTLLDLIGIDIETPMVGRNIYELNENTKGRAIMQFHSTNAFRVGEELIVLQSGKEPVQFNIDENDSLSPAELNKDLAKDALSHIITASDQYNKRKYKLKQKEK